MKPTLSARALQIQPVERAETIPASWYLDPAFDELEREAVFARTWQHVGHVSQVPDAGDHLVVMVARRPILVVRAGDGEIHAFYNV